MAKLKPPTAKQRAYWERVRAVGCIVKKEHECHWKIDVHHCFTNAGGRKDHDIMLPLCFNLHRGPQGIHTLKHPVWEPIYGTEEELLEQLKFELEGY